MRTRTRALACYPDVRMRGLDNFKKATKETERNRIVVSVENFTILMDGKEIN